MKNCEKMVVDVMRESGLYIIKVNIYTHILRFNQDELVSSGQLACADGEHFPIRVRGRDWK